MLAVAASVLLAAGSAGAATAAPPAPADGLAAFAGDIRPVGGELTHDRGAVRLRDPSTRLTQQYLRRRGYAPGPITDRLTPQTRSALRAFQRDCGLPANGAAVTSTQQRLIRPGSCPSGK